MSLRALSCEVSTESDGGRGLLKALESSIDVLVVDVSLPTMNGLDICRKVRERKPLLPILMLTSRSSETDIVLGLEQGADDYLAKPFRMAEVIARLRALLRRAEASAPLRAGEPGRRPAAEERLQFGQLIISFDSRIVTVAGETIELTALEFDVLGYLATQHGKIVHRDQLLEDVWGGLPENADATLNVLLSRLRKKLSGVGMEVISTVRGVGYRFALQPTGAE